MTEFTVPVPDLHYTPGLRGPIEVYTKEHLRDVLEQAAKACESIGKKYRDLFTGVTSGSKPTLADIYEYAVECEDKIRKMIGEIK